MWKFVPQFVRSRARRRAERKTALFSRSIESLEARQLLTGYVQTNLAADQTGAALVQDPNVVNPWGVVVGAASGNFVVANNGSAAATQYQGLVSGSAFSTSNPTIGIPGGFPTADVINTTTDFAIGNPGGSTSPASAIFATQTGLLAAWNSSLSPTGQAVTAASVSGADFTGLALGASGGHNYIYAADFQNGKIDIFDVSFHQTSLAGSFTDSGLPAGYAPFNIQSIGGKFYVTYAFQQATGEEGGGSGASFFTPRPTGGIVDVFNTDGTFVKEFSTDSHLNAPWGMATAPASFGTYANDLLVANFGDGRISAFDPTTGSYLGQLADTSSNPISISGLRGLSFGNGATAGDANALYFTAEPGAASNPPESAAVILLDPSSQGALSAVGNGAVKVTGGGEIAVNSNKSSAVVAIGNGQVSAAEIDVAGTPGILGLGGGSISGTVDSGAAATSDPLASLAAPAVPSQTFSEVEAEGKDNITLSPGQYKDGIHVSGSATVTLQPGVYYLQGGLSVTGQATLTGNGVMIYDASQEDDDGIKVAGSGTLNVTAMTSGTYRGIAIFTRGGEESEIRIEGNGTANVTGVIYAPSSTVKISGNGQLAMQGDAAHAIAAQLIAGDLNVFGNGQFNLASTPTAGLNSGEHGLFGMLQTAGASPLAATSVNFSVTEGQQFSGGVAAFTATSPTAVVSDFTATIDWGDGTTTAGTVTAGGAGGFLVSGSHQYAEEGTQTVKVTIHDTSSNTITAQDAVAVADAPLYASGTHFLATPGQTQHGVVVGSFTDAAGAEPASDFTATIDWGDGTTSAGTVVSLGGGGAFNVTGDHAYSQAGVFSVTVSVADDGGASTTIHSLAGNGHADDDDEFLSQVFKDVLGRDADAGAEAHFKSLLKQGISREAIASQLTHSDEYFDQRIEQSYKNYLGRNASAQDIAFWRLLMHMGMTDEQMEAAFIGSAEFYSHSGGNDRAWVDEMYFDLLGRSPDAAGEAYWTGVLAHGGNRSQVAAGFAASLEREGQTVHNDYLTYLGRQPSQDELNHWVNQFHNGATNEQIVAGFTGSNEYFQQQTKND